MPGSVDRMNAIPARTSGWSSTSTTRSGPRRPRRPSATAPRACRRGAGPGSHADDQPAAGRRRRRRRTCPPTARTRSAMPCVPRPTRPALGGAAPGRRGAVARPSTARPTGSAREHDVGRGAGRVLQHVRQRLLHDAVDDELDGRVERRRRARASSASTSSPAPRNPSTRCGTAAERRAAAGGAAESGSRSRPITWRIESRLSRPTTSARASASSAPRRVGRQGPAGAGQVEHHDGQRVGDDVVDLAGDACPLGGRQPLDLGVAHRLAPAR